MFDERHESRAQNVVNTDHLGQKIYKEPDTEWQKNVKTMRKEDYYNKLMNLEEEQLLKEARLRETTHQFAIPGEKVINSSVAKGMAQQYQDNL